MIVFCCGYMDGFFIVSRELKLVKKDFRLVMIIYKLVIIWDVI